ncbi:MAG TPA: sulfatase-like hydrolase/transferase [Bryobacteraceae bacterium]|nr:sulfatase-like hydrolase/transferase [Bryobacteraceae bacterium]
MLRYALLALVTLSGQAATPVILISVDTLRADHLSCYQAGRRPTPHIDSLAKPGTLFSQVSSPFPLTLPSHVALFTSTPSFVNGVQDNGIPLKAPRSTLAAALKAAGYRTGAFVGSFVLDRRFGLNQGFDVYEGPLDVHNKVNAGPMERKRPGAEVAEAAMRWVERNADRPFFLFLHLYDLHLPYDLPQNPSLRHGEAGYSAELGYEDRVLGDFLAFLAKRGLLEKSLIVFTSDHGEGLGDHGESTHGYFLYQSTLHVPLIMHWPAGFQRITKERVDEPASLLDVAPTILDAVGVPKPAAMRGRSLIGGGAAEVYSESVYARNHFGCAPLRSLRAGRYKYIETPKPELYDLANDPNEEHNLYGQERQRALGMSDKIAALRKGRVAAPAGSPRPDAIAGLRTLGYASGLSGPAREPTVDAKDRIADFERYVNALSLASSGRLAESTSLLKGLREKVPDVAEIRTGLGLNLERQGDYAAAAREFSGAAEADPGDAQAHFELGFCYFRMGRADEAERALTAALTLEPWYTRADEALAQIYIQKKDFPNARAHLNHLLAVDPDSYPAHYNLGIFAAMEGKWGEAQQHIEAALRADPGSAEAHETLGKVYLQEGKTAEAEKEFQAARR